MRAGVAWPLRTKRRGKLGRSPQAEGGLGHSHINECGGGGGPFQLFHTGERKTLFAGRDSGDLKTGLHGNKKPIGQVKNAIYL